MKLSTDSSSFLSAFPVPLFDFAETERIARAVGFNPLGGLARECLRDTEQSLWNFPDYLTEQQRFQAHFYLAVGLFIWWKYCEEGLPIPASVQDWYEINTARTTFETLFATDAAIADMEALV